MKMKVLWLALTVVAAVAFFSIFAAGEGESTKEEELLRDMSELADKLSHGDSNMGGIFGEDVTVSGERLLESLSLQRVGVELSRQLSLALPDALELLCVLLATVATSAVTAGLVGGVGAGETATGVSLLSSAAMAAALVSSQYSFMERTLNFFEDVGVLMNGMIPVTGAVWAMGGNVSSAGLGTATLYGMLNATRGLCSSAVTPLCAVMIIAALCSALSEGGLLEGFASAVKRIYTFFVGLVMTVFVFVLGVQTSVAGAADTVAARSGKLFAATVIPVVGGAVGDTLRVVAGSVEYVKSIVGVGGIMLLAYITLPTLISLLLSRLALSVSASAAQMLGCSREYKLLSELGGVYGFLTGAVAVCASAFAIALGIFVRCTAAVG